MVMKRRRRDLSEPCEPVHGREVLVADLAVVVEHLFDLGVPTGRVA